MRLHLFAGEFHDAPGGLAGYIGSFDTEEEAFAYMHENSREPLFGQWDWADLVIEQDGRLVLHSEWQSRVQPGGATWVRRP